MAGRVFEYHPEAIVEAWEAFHWYKERSAIAADRFWEEIQLARQLATQQPETWTTYLHGTRSFKLQRLPFALVYVERGDRVIGIAVAHLKRRPGYWRKRLAE